ncbi:MAG TPA: hypothetical protein VHK69_02465 [Chitinophagaceae bacterium]|jgi:hypothetical protein|nr:hypothetical protein [Chitinophagaceae bacterium]
MTDRNNKGGINYQDGGHHEGQQNNTVPQKLSRGMDDNVTSSMSEMLNESDEQKAGPAHGQKDESGVQQDERQP